MFRNIAGIFLFTAMLSGCMRTIIVEDKDPRVVIDVNYHIDSNNILIKDPGFAKDASSMEIKFKRISISKHGQKIIVEGIIRDHPTLQPIPGAYIALVSNKNGQQRLDKKIPTTDSLGRFNFTAKIDTSSLIFLDYEGYQSRIYHIGYLLK